MKIIVTSDFHGYLPSIPKGDLLLICGDIVPLDIQSNGRKSKKWFKTIFTDWAANIAVDKILFIAGNHDWMAYWDNGVWLHNQFPKESKITYLQDEEFIYKGIKIYGTPWCKIFYNWAFNINDEGLKEKYKQIPNDVDILLTHDACGINRVGVIHEGSYMGTLCDNSVLTEAILNKQPKYAFCGHIHSGNHTLTKIDTTYFANVSYLNEKYEPTYDPLEFNYEKENI